MTCLALNAYFALTAPAAFGVEFAAQTHPDPSLRLLFVIDAAEPLLPAEQAPAFREAFFSAYQIMHDIWEELGVARHASRSYLAFMDRATTLDAERHRLADQHQELLDQLTPYDLRS